MFEAELIALVVIVLICGIGVTVMWYRANKANKQLGYQVELQNTVIEQIGERATAMDATPVAVLRHHHTFGPKGADQIRWCRCGDRYLDGMVVTR